VLAEWAFIFLPILFHGGYGIYIWLRGESTYCAISVDENWLYTFQRYTGVIAFAYIGWHVYTQRWVTHGLSTYGEVAQQMRNPWAFRFHVVGVWLRHFILV